MSLSRSEISKSIFCEFFDFRGREALVIFGDNFEDIVFVFVANDNDLVVVVDVVVDVVVAVLLVVDDDVVVVDADVVVDVDVVSGADVDEIVDVFCFGVAVVDVDFGNADVGFFDLLKLKIV